MKTRPLIPTRNHSSHRVSIPMNLLALCLGMTFLPFHQNMAASVALPYTNDFALGSADFVKTAATGASWSDSTEMETETLQYFAGGPGQVGNAMVDTTEIGGTSPLNFTASTTFTVAKNTGTNNQWGLALLADLADSTKPTELLWASWSTDNELRISNVGGSSISFAQDTSSSISFSLNTVYTLTATGSYTGTDLILSLQVSDGTNSATLVTTAIDTSTEFNGTAMGLRVRSGPGSTGITVRFDSYEMAVAP